jgi:gliding motility-associated-like protein
VNPLPNTTITPSGPTSFCQGGSVTLSAPGGATSYLWNTGETSQSINVIVSGTYTVTVTNSGCTATSNGTTVTVKPIPTVPTIIAAGSTTFCNTGSVTLNAAGGGTSYQWYKDGILINGQTGSSLNVTSAGNYQATTFNDGCQSALSTGVQVIVNTVINPILSSENNKTTICKGGSLLLSAASETTPFTYQWYKDGNIISGETKATYLVTQAGKYKVTITSINGCLSGFSNEIEIKEVTAATPTIKAADTTTFCIGSSVVLTSTAAASYQWYKDGVLISGAASQSYTANQTGSYSVIVRNDLGCVSDTSDVVVVTAKPIPSAPISISGPTNVLIISNETYTAETVAGASSYNWTLPSSWTGSSSTNIINVTVKGNPGIDTIYVSATVNGCTGPNAKLVVTSKLAPDHDKDGYPDDEDLDDDNDGILDTVEYSACGFNIETCDTDGDGIRNSFDLDSDGDGISDVLESDGKDANNDGMADGKVDANGVPSSANGGNPPPDTDRDGKMDPYDLDTDGDGIPDKIEGQGPTQSGQPLAILPSGKDTDGDGLDDAYDNDNGGKYIIPVDTDKDGKPDWRDLDTDNDGIPDEDEAGNDPSKPLDKDSDTIYDFREVDSDGDRIPDGETLLIYKTSQLQTTASPDGSFEMKFTIILKNNRSVPLTNVTVTDDLTKTFPSPIQFTVLDYKTSGTLLKAPGFNGNTNTSLLAGGSTLAGFGTDSINITISLKFNGYEGDINNLAEAKAISKWGPVVRQSIDLRRSSGRAHGLPGVPTYDVAPKLNLLIPDVITPNNDGVNDKWTIIHSSTVKIGVTIFNRWGQVVYKSDDYQNDWNGVGKQNFLGQNLPHGTYYYLVDITNKSNGVKEVKKGFLTLRRDY